MNSETVWYLKAFLAIGIIVTGMFVAIYLIYVTNASPLSFFISIGIWMVIANVGNWLIDEPKMKKIGILTDEQEQQG